MWNNLRSFYKALIILVVFFVVFYILGRFLFVEANDVNQLGGYWTMPFVYSVFFVAPILTLKYSSNRGAKIFASAILGFFLLVIIFALSMFGREWFGNIDNFSENPFVSVLTFLYTLPAISAIVSAMALFGGAM